MNRIIRLFLAVSSTSLLGLSYLIKAQPGFSNLSLLIRCAIILTTIAATILLAWILLKFLTSSDDIEQDSLKAGDISNIENINNHLLPSYLGYFFVGLSINDIFTLVWIYGIVLIFVYHSQALYFNPIFIIFGYAFHIATTDKKTSILLITQSQYRSPAVIEIDHLARINDFTFIERNS